MYFEDKVVQVDSMLDLGMVIQGLLGCRKKDVVPPELGPQDKVELGRLELVDRNHTNRKASTADKVVVVGVVGKVVEKFELNVGRQNV